MLEAAAVLAVEAEAGNSGLVQEVIPGAIPGIEIVTAKRTEKRIGVPGADPQRDRIVVTTANPKVRPQNARTAVGTQSLRVRLIRDHDLEVVRIHAKMAMMTKEDNVRNSHTFLFKLQIQLLIYENNKKIMVTILFYNLLIIFLDIRSYCGPLSI